MEQTENNSSHIRMLQAVLLFTAMFSAMGGPALAPALPAIKAAYSEVPHIEFCTKLLVAVSGGFAAVGAPVFGWFSDRYGRRRALVLAIGLWSVAGASGMLPQALWTLLVGRALLGFSLGGLLAVNTAMIADCFNQQKQRHMMGLQSTFSSSGVILSLIVSGWLADFHWRMAFSIFLLGFALLPFAIKLPDSPQTSSEPSAAKPRVFSFALGILCFFGFMAMLVFNIMPTQLPFFMRSQGAVSAAKIGMMMAMLPLSSALTARIYARISRFFTLWNLFLLSGVCMLAGLWTISYSDSSSGIIVGLCLIGMGFGTAIPHGNVVLAQVIAPESRGRAMGIMTGCKFLGLSASPILLQPILVNTSYAATFRIAGGIMLAVAVLVSLLGFFQSKQEAVPPQTPGVAE